MKRSAVSGEKRREVRAIFWQLVDFKSICIRTLDPIDSYPIDFR